MNLKSNKILILGAGGFIGGNIYKNLVDDGWDVVGTDRKGDLEYLDVLKEGWKSFIDQINPDVIINCIAYGNAHQHDNSALIESVTYEFAHDLIEYCSQNLRLKCFIQMGSSSEYGSNCAYADEEFVLKPNSEYSIQKGRLSSYCKGLIDKENFPLLYLRLFSVFGPNEPANRLIPTLIRNAKNGKWPELGSPNVARDLIHVDDVVRLISQILRSPSRVAGIYNVCTGVNTTIATICDEVKTAFQLNSEPIFNKRPNHKWDLEKWYGNPNKTKAQFNWRPEIKLSDYLKQQAHVG